MRKHVQRFGLFEGREILSLQVLDEGNLHDLGVVRLANHAGQFLQADLYRGLVAAFARDDLEPLAPLPEHQRLDDALLGNRRHQFGQVAHDLSRLVWIGIDEVNRYHAADRRAP